MSTSQPWYHDLVQLVERRIDLACRLYPDGDRRIVLSNVIRALHRRADRIDESSTWLHIALGAADVDESAARAAAAMPFEASQHPSVGDAEDLAEDLSSISIPGRRDSPAVTIRTAVHVAWTRFAPELDLHGRALLAAEAARMA